MLMGASLFLPFTYGIVMFGLTLTTMGLVRAQIDLGPGWKVDTVKCA